MKYSEALQFLNEQLPFFQKQGKTAFKAGLDNIYALCEMLQNPQNDIRTIHIAGTNGKGSTAHILAAVLQCQGLKVGLFTSPHYRDFRERIKINGRYIPKRRVSSFIQKYQLEIKNIQPSFFEVSVALAFHHFKKQNVDIAIIEAGLGGKDDTTNIIQPILSIITNVSYDHTDILGETLQEIAIAKAGIIKKDTPVVIGKRQEEVETIFLEKAKRENASFYFANDNSDLNRLGFQNLSGFESSSFQIENIKTALKAIEILNQNRLLKINNQSIITGISNIQTLTNFKGRWQILNQKPLIIADSAHNEAGIQMVVQQLLALKAKELHIVFGMVKDKNWQAVLKLLPKTANYYFCEPKTNRALSVEDLHEFAKRIELKGKAYSSIKRAVNAAKKRANKDDVIFIGGSSYLVVEVI